MKTLNIFSFLLLLTLSFSCSNNQNGQESEHEEHEHNTDAIVLTQEQMKTVGISVGKLEKKQLNSVIHTNGQLQLNPQDIADVTSLLGGTLQKILVTEGQSVRAGQVVAYVENTEIVNWQKDYLVAIKETTMAEQEYQRQKTLSAQNAGVEKTLQRARADYEMAHARMKGLMSQLRQIGISPAAVAAGKIMSRFPVSTPISGVVTKVNVNSGAYAEPSTPLMQVANNQAVYCKLNVFEQNISQVQLGQSVDFVVTNAPNTHYQGTISQIVRSIDPETKTMAVQVRIEGSKASLIPGMYVSALISTGKQSVNALPDGAIVSENGKKYVFSLSKKEKEKGREVCVFKRVEVMTGTSSLGYTQVDFMEKVAPNASFATAKAFYIASMTAEHGEH